MPNELVQLRLLLRRMQRVAQVTARATEGPWWFEEDGTTWRLHGGGVRQILKAPKSGTPYAEYWPNGPDSAHMVRWNPLVVLELVECFQQIVADHQPVKADDGSFYCQRCTPTDQPWTTYPCTTVQLVYNFWAGVEQAGAKGVSIMRAFQDEPEP